MNVVIKTDGVDDDTYFRSSSFLWYCYRHCYLTHA